MNTRRRSIKDKRTTWLLETRAEIIISPITHITYERINYIILVLIIYVRIVAILYIFYGYLTMLSTTLIERALALTGKTMEDMNINPILCKFSIEKFFYYLISEEFTDKYRAYCDEFNLDPEMDFLYAIRDYQLWNKKPLIELLSEI